MKQVISAVLCLLMCFSSFCMSPITAGGEEAVINIDDIPLDWTGEYDGHGGGISPLRRNFDIYIRWITASGIFRGVAIISPSDKGVEGYGVNGKYSFEGNIDLSTGEITLQGDRWIEYPVGFRSKSFTFASFKGVLDIESKTILGETTDGIWNMSAKNYDNYNSNNGFRLTCDNNSFVHYNDVENELDGFKGVTDYHIDDEYFKELVSRDIIMPMGKSVVDIGEMCYIKYLMNRDWGGSCYGIASTMGLLFNGQIGIDYLSDTGSNNYFNLPYPCDDRRFLNVINYYQLSRSLLSESTPLSAISTTFYKNKFGLSAPQGVLYDSMSVFLQKMVDEVSNDGIKLFSYFYTDETTKNTNSEEQQTVLEEYGHAILAVDCRYNESEKEYVITMYDENSVSNKMPRGNYTYMTISNDFSSFSYTAPNGVTINSDDYVSLELRDFFVINDISEIRSGSTLIDEEVNHIRLVMPMTDYCKVYNDQGKYLTCSEKGLSGNMRVYSLDTLIDDNNSKIVVEVDESSYLTLKEISEDIDIQVYDSYDFMSLDTTKIEEAVLSFDENNINIVGDDYTFESYISVDYEVDDNENGLVSVTADAYSDVTIDTNDNSVSVMSDEELENVFIESLIGTDVYTMEYTEFAKEYNFSLDYKEGEKLRGLQSGDINGDNDITAVDAFCVLREIAGYDSINSYQEKLADVTGDGKISSQDVLEILRYSVGYSGTSNVGKYLN